MISRPVTAEGLYHAYCECCTRTGESVVWSANAFMLLPMREKIAWRRLAELVEETIAGATT